VSAVARANRHVTFAGERHSPDECFESTEHGRGDLVEVGPELEIGHDSQEDQAVERRMVQRRAPEAL
jgi:hypothetical protein